MLASLQAEIQVLRIVKIFYEQSFVVAAVEHLFVVMIFQLIVVVVVVVAVASVVVELSWTQMGLLLINHMVEYLVTIAALAKHFWMTVSMNLT